MLYALSKRSQPRQEHCSSTCSSWCFQELHPGFQSPHPQLSKINKEEREGNPLPLIQGEKLEKRRSLMWLPCWKCIRKSVTCITKFIFCLLHLQLFHLKYGYNTFWRLIISPLSSAAWIFRDRIESIFYTWCKGVTEVFTRGTFGESYWEHDWGCGESRASSPANSWEWRCTCRW